MKIRLMLVVAMLLSFLVTLCAQDAQARKEYVVKPGDTLGEIVFTLRAEGIDVKQLQGWNPRLGTQIQAGDHIVYFTPEAPLSQASEAKQQDAEATLRDITERTKRVESNEASMKIIGYGIVVILMIILCALGAGLMFRKNRLRVLSVSQPAKSPEPENRMPDLSRISDPGRLMQDAAEARIYPANLPADPTQQMVLDHANESGKLFFIIFLTLDDGVMTPCIALAVPSATDESKSYVLVYHELAEFNQRGDMRPDSSWKQRRRDAANLHFPILAKNASTNASTVVH
jgi:hypothetical protein